KAAPRRKDENPSLADFEFEDIELIDSGGYGTVYKARRHGQLCAVKAAKLGKTGMELLAREGLLLKRVAKERGLSCEHLIQVYDVIEHGDTVPVAMEYADGGSLTDRIGPSGCRAVVADETSRPGRIVAEFLSVVDGVRHLHRNGIVHRDLK